MTTTDAVTSRTTRAPIAWKRAPLDRTGIAQMAAAWLVATGVLTLVGLAIVRWWEGSALGDADADLSRWLEDHRTERLTAISERMSMSSDTLTKVILGVVLIPVFLWLFRRWHEYAVIFGGLVLEVCVYGVSARLVGRDRPPVEQLDGSPTGISFPSGHIAAATVFYGGLAVIVFMQTRRRGPRAIAAVVAVAMPLAVTWGRLYLGMHYLSDAVAGILLGVFVLAVTRHAVPRTLPPDESPELHDAGRAHPPGFLADARDDDDVPVAGLHPVDDRGAR
jgi:membrane-associated phospholipid phosphatase